uniref:Uncharacterized protein n=1 Tax=Avena sativa TaxID=4498 RepID=A0ACD5ZJ07_AVESA
MKRVVTLSGLVSSLLLVTVMMVAGEDLHTDPMSAAEGTVVSNSAAVTAYWHAMLPNTPMPLAILELLTPPDGNNDLGKHDNTNIRIVVEGTAENYVEASISNARKLGLHSTKEKTTKKNLAKETQEKRTIQFKVPSAKTGEIGTENFQLGPATNDQRTAYFRWGPGPATNDQKTAYFRWGPATNDQRTAYFRWGPATNDQRTAYFRWGPKSKESTSNGQGEGRQDGVRHHMHDDFTMLLNNTVFVEEALTPGSTVIPYIRPSAIPGGAPLLRRDVADSIPMSTENFTDIIGMYAPASHAMARDIWSTLDICEHLRPIKGEKKTCVTSVESMVEFAASVVAGGNTRDLRAFSSPDVPAEGVTSGRSYKVAAARSVTKAGDTVTCHNMKFPVAAYMCHAVNPTRVYTVALESMDDDVAGTAGEEVGQRMEALAVCHLDTSEFGAMTMPEHIKPGDAPVCHFISRDSVLWARTAPAAAAY